VRKGEREREREREKVEGRKEPCSPSTVRWDEETGHLV